MTLTTGEQVKEKDIDKGFSGQRSPEDLYFSSHENEELLVGIFDDSPSVTRYNSLTKFCV